MKKCIYTMCRDENIFLPIWLKYYSQFFAPEDIYVFDHRTSDGSVEEAKKNFKFNHIFVDHVGFGDLTWYTPYIKELQKKFLKIYDVVTFTEPDEIIYHPKGLGTYIDNFQFPTVRCLGYMIWHNREQEPDFDPTKTILSQRSFWFRDTHEDKPLISKVPLAWGYGFHYCAADNIEEVHAAGESIINDIFDKELLLFHLHMLDFNSAEKKHAKNVNYSDLDQDAVKNWQGWQTRITGDVFRDWFDARWGQNFELIPNAIKLANFI